MDLIEVLEDYKTYVGVSVAFGAGEGSYERLEQQVLSLLDQYEEYEAYNVFYDIMDRRSLNADSLLDALSFTLDVLK